MIGPLRIEVSRGLAMKLGSEIAIAKFLASNGMPIRPNPLTGKWEMTAKGKLTHYSGVHWDRDVYEWMPDNGPDVIDVEARVVSDTPLISTITQQQYGRR